MFRKKESLSFWFQPCMTENKCRNRREEETRNQLFLQSNERRSGHGRPDVVELFCCREDEQVASVFFHLLNIAGINAQVVYFSNTQDKILRRHLLGQLSEALTTQHIKTRLMNSNFPTQLTARINLYLGKV